MVNAYSTGWLKRGFPWVYPAEVVRGRARPGDHVELRGEGGAVLGTAIADSGWLAARRFRSTAGALDAPWLSERVGIALRARRHVGLIEESSVAHAEGARERGARAQREAQIAALDAAHR